MTHDQINKAAEELECLWLIHRKTNWPHEYAENGIVNFSGLKKIVESALSHSRQEIEELKAENAKLREAIYNYSNNIVSLKKPAK